MQDVDRDRNGEPIKIVLVGDVNVGKTRLICARAYRKPTPIEQFPKVAHNSSVWAIDQYRLDSSVLFNSYVNVDNVLVSHRLWDTFGAHDRDRRFAFGHADVVLLCFSICSAQSLRSVKRFWYEEARRHRKNIPYFIVGCKADLRHCDLDKFNAHRGQLAPKVKKSDILFPWEGREVANEMKLPYYETSCVTGDGVDDLFTNALRAALLTRRRFWRSHLKGVQRPLPQAPLLPPMPPEETIQIQLSAQKSEDNKENVKNQHCLPLFAPFFRCQTNSDLNLQIGKTTFHAHRCIIHSKTDRFDLKGESALSLEAIEYIYDVGGLGEKITQSPIRFLSEYESKAARLSLLQNGKYSDVTLVLEDGKIEAHRILLASGSELMRAMLIGSWREAESKEIKLTDIYYDQMVECCRWIYARVLPDWSCPTKKLIEMIPIVSRLCLTVYFHKLENVIIDRLKNSTLHIGLRFGIQIKKSPGGMTSPLAVLSEAAYAYEQMEKLNQLKLASSPVASSIANSYGALGAYGPGAYGATPSVPMLLVVPSLYGLNSQNQALLHQQAAALSGLNPAFYPSGLTSSPTHPSQGQTHAAAYGIAPQPPTNLVLNASLSTGNRSLGSEESDLPPWHVPREVPSAQPSSPKAPVKTSTIVRNPTHNSAPSGEIQKVKMRQKKVRNQVDHHFRRSLGSNYETPVLKKRPATIAYSEVDDHFERVFGAEEWKKLQAKRKKMNRHSVI